MRPCTRWNVEPTVCAIACTMPSIADPNAMRRRATKAAEAIATFTGALDATMRALVPYLEPLAITARLEGGDRAGDAPSGRGRTR